MATNIRSRKTSRSSESIAKESSKIATKTSASQALGKVSKRGHNHIETNNMNHNGGFIVDSKSRPTLAIKTDHVYAQVARVSRNPKKDKETKLLMNALDKAVVEVRGDRGIKRVVREYVLMNKDEAQLCFGKKLSRLSKLSVIHAGKDSE